MKKISIAIAMVGFTLSAFAQQTVGITGQLLTERKKPVKLFAVENGAPTEIANIKPTQEGHFGFQFYPEYEGLYLIGTGTTMSPQDSYKFWLKPGDQLAVHITDSGYNLVGDYNSPENRILSDWNKFAWELEWKSIYFMKNRSTYVDFFPLLNETLPKTQPWLKSQPSSGNKKFDNQLKKIVELDMAFIANNYLSTPRTVHPSPEELPAYYATLNASSLFPNTADVYSYPWGMRAFTGLVYRSQITDKVAFTPGIAGVLKSLEYVSNDTLKGDIAIEYAGRLKDYAGYLEFKDKAGKYLLTENQKAKVFVIEASLATLKPGDQGFEFAFEDNKGGKVAFSDLKGKVLLVDVWATWCGPCRAEFPHLRKLKEEFEGTDVQVVGISVDEAKDKEKWKQMIVDEQLGGIQLFATGWSEITKFYKINGIPRFMVFDRDGRIVTTDAPRPSNPELKALLQKELAKK